MFGTVYDLATIAILWFAGASAMAGLLNLIPRYLPRYGMAPEWARASRPLVLIITGIAFLVTLLFKADVDAQAGAYATGVLVLMTSVAFAAMISTPRRRVAFGVRPGGVPLHDGRQHRRAARRADDRAWFIVTMVASSLVSRVMRSTELRAHGVRLRRGGRGCSASAKGSPLRIIANRPDTGLPDEYDGQAARGPRSAPSAARCARRVSRDASGRRVGVFRRRCISRAATSAAHQVLSTQSPAIPNAIAAILLDLRDRTGVTPHAYFGWTEGNPITYLLRFLAFGKGDTAPVAREVLRQAERRARTPAADSRRVDEPACWAAILMSGCRRDWAELPDEQLLSLRLSDLPLTLEGTVVERRASRSSGPSSKRATCAFRFTSTSPTNGSRRTARRRWRCRST